MLFAKGFAKGFWGVGIDCLKGCILLTFEVG